MKLGDLLWAATKQEMCVNELVSDYTNVFPHSVTVLRDTCSLSVCQPPHRLYSEASPGPRKSLTSNTCRPRAAIVFMWGTRGDLQELCPCDKRQGQCEGKRQQIRPMTQIQRAEDIMGTDCAPRSCSLKGVE